MQARPPAFSTHKICFAVLLECARSNDSFSRHTVHTCVLNLHEEHAKIKSYLHHSGDSRPALRPRLVVRHSRSCPGIGGTLAGLTLLMLPVALQTPLRRPRPTPSCLMMALISRWRPTRPDNPLFRAPAPCAMLSCSSGCSCRESERRMQAEDGMARGRAPGRHEEPVLPINNPTTAGAGAARS